MQLLKYKHLTTSLLLTGLLLSSVAKADPSPNLLMTLPGMTTTGVLGASNLQEKLSQHSLQNQDAENNLLRQELARRQNETGRDEILKAGRASLLITH